MSWYVEGGGWRVCDTLLFYRVAYLPGLVPRYERYHYKFSMAVQNLVRLARNCSYEPVLQLRAGS